MFKKYLAIGMVLSMLTLFAGCVVHPYPYRPHRGYAPNHKSVVVVRPHHHRYVWPR